MEKLLYKCIPDDKRIPIFLVPYEIKNLGFNKALTNQYVTFKFADWVDKHPIGSLVGTIGPVDVLSSYFEYQLYCKSLNASIQKFTRDTQRKIKLQTGGNSEETIIENIINDMTECGNALTDRTTDFIFSIDPNESADF
jgi:exoribonuclease R